MQTVTVKVFMKQKWSEQQKQKKAEMKQREATAEGKTHHVQNLYRIQTNISVVEQILVASKINKKPLKVIITCGEKIVPQLQQHCLTPSQLKLQGWKSLKM